jgi:hypothetical protein
MTLTASTDLLSPEVLTEAVRGAFAQKTAFMGSRLAALGVVVVSGSMPEGGPKAIGQTIKVPYFGTLGEFSDGPEATPAVPAKLRQTSEDATITRSYLSFEMSTWAQGSALTNPMVGDPYEEGARQLLEAATRRMDKLITTEAASAGIFTKDVHNSTVPRQLDWDLVVDACRDGWGDEQEDKVAMLVHSTTEADLLKLKDSTGRPLLLESQTAEGTVRKMAGMEVVVSDRLPLTSSLMGAVTSSGTTPPVATLAGTPLGAWRLAIDCEVSHGSDTTIKFSLDGGYTWSASIAAADDGVPVALIDTTADSLVGVNGLSGITVAFASGTFNADNAWTATAALETTSLLLKKRSLAFWYASGHLNLQTDKDILLDSDIAAVHLYAAPHRYRRMATGTKPGVIPIIHNVSGY